MRIFLYLSLVLILVFAPATAGAAGKAAERAVGGPTAAERASEMAQLRAELESSGPGRSVSHYVDLNDEELDILANRGVDDTGLFRVGLSRNSNLQLSAAGDDLEIISVGNSIRLRVQVISGTFYAWDEAGRAHSYTESGWTHTFQAPVRVRTTGAAVVTQLGIINLVGEGLCAYNADCVENASCVTDMPSAVETATDAVGHMLFAQGPYYYICSGALIADSDESTEIPYFLTANHCLSKNNVASTLEVYFQYTIPCNQECGPYDRPDTPRTLGATVEATSRTSDYTLLRLSEAAPAGSVFLGWNSDPVANSNDTLYRLSHPAGAPQSYSEHVVDTSKDTCRSWPRGNWIYSRDTFGATEGGSSGSALMNALGQIVGQLSGACGYNVGDVCDADSNATVDGAFAAYYDDVAGILGGGDPEPPEPPPPGECTDADGDGYCAEVDDCDDSDSHVHPGHNDTRGRWGRDGVDNDCNLIVDG